MTTAAARYAAMEARREPYLARAREQSKLTIPYLFPEFGTSGSTKYYTPYQSFGSNAVNSLANKLIMALFPPNAPFYRFSLDEIVTQKLTGDEKRKTDIDERLAKIERRVLNKIEASPFRSTAIEAGRQLLVGGNVCVYCPEPKSVKLFKLNQYVVRRSNSGMVLEAVIKEFVDRLSLSSEVLALVEQNKSTLPSDKPLSQSDQIPLEVYTYVQKVADKDMYTVFQEINGVKLADTAATHPADRCPYIFLRWTKLDGEDYGRGLVEDYYGDLYTHEGLSEAITSGSIIHSKVVFFADPTGSTRAEDVTEAENGAVVEGRSSDITTLQVDKVRDLSFVQNQIEYIERRLQRAFMMTAAIQRNGERVTAEEIRLLAADLESNLGGIYSVLSQEFQLRIVNITMAALERSNDITPLPSEIQPMIITGIEALGRGVEGSNLSAFARDLRNEIGEEPVKAYLNGGEYIRRKAQAYNVSPTGLVKTDDEVASEQQDQQLAALGPNAIAAGGQLAAATMKQGMTNE